MKRLLLFLLFVVAATSCSPQAALNDEAAKWQRQAQNVTIVRDDWGIAHVHGKRDGEV